MRALKLLPLVYLLGFSLAAMSQHIDSDLDNANTPKIELTRPGQVYVSTYVSANKAAAENGIDVIISGPSYLARQPQYQLQVKKVGEGQYLVTKQILAGHNPPNQPRVEQQATTSFTVEPGRLGYVGIKIIYPAALNVAAISKK